jgi:hypothetical protein
MRGSRGRGRRDRLVCGEIDGAVAAFTELVPPVHIVELRAGGAAVVLADEVEVQRTGLSDESS